MDSTAACRGGGSVFVNCYSCVYFAIVNPSCSISLHQLLTKPYSLTSSLSSSQIHLDLAKEAVLVPLPSYGHVPFHASTIRNVFCQAEDKKYHVFRIQFQVPGSIGFGYKVDANPFPEVSGPKGMFIKELIFRSSNREHFVIYTVSNYFLMTRVNVSVETCDRSFVFYFIF